MRVDCRKLFSKYLFLVGEIGGNDYLVPLTFHRLTEEQVTAYVPTVVEAINNATEVGSAIPPRLCIP